MTSLRRWSRRTGPNPSSRVADVLNSFDRPGTNSGPTEAINSRLEHTGGSAPWFRNLTNHDVRSLLEVGGVRPVPHRQLRRARIPADGGRIRSAATTRNPHRTHRTAPQRPGGMVTAG